MSDPTKKTESRREADAGHPAQRLGRPVTRHVVIPLVAAVVGLIGALAGAAVGGIATYHATTAAERAHESANNAATARTKRGKVYASYLNSANDYLSASQSLATKSASGITFTPGHIKRWSSAIRRYQSAVNRVYVYGSDAAWEAQMRVASTLPPTDHLQVAIGQSVHGVDAKAFNAAYQRFQTVFCREVPAVPRSGC